MGGTAIDTGCSSTSGKYWSADPKWLAANYSTATGGKSLLLSFTENISACIDNKLDKLPDDMKSKLFYGIKAKAIGTKAKIIIKI